MAWTSRAEAGPIVGTNVAVDPLWTGMISGPKLLRATGIGSGTDPVVHVLDSSGVQIADSDDYAPPLRYAQVWLPSGTWRVVLHSYDYAPHGTAKLELSSDGGASWTTFLSSVSLGGSVIPLSPSVMGPVRVESVSLRSGGLQTDTVTFAAAWGGQSGYLIEAWNDDGGTMPGDRVSVPALDPMRALIIGTYLWSGAVNLYINDYADDPDGDGLGRQLEAALGTCEGGTSCPNAFTTRDSDHDGIEDAHELLGVAMADWSKNLHLPAWGADPLAKDMFIEVDWTSATASGTGGWWCTSSFQPPEGCPCTPGAPGCAWPSPPFTEGVARRVSDRYAKGTDTELRTPGKPGIRLHFDAGRTCTDTSLCGPWGGGGEYLTDPTARSMDATRDHFFHYGRAHLGGGQNPYYVDTIDAGIFAFDHEMGHSLGLSHGGHDSLPDGTINCKANYRSLMSYTMGSEQPAPAGFYEFSHGTLAPLNPSRVHETATMAGHDVRYLGAAWPTSQFDYPIAGSGGGVDWNRDGFLNAVHVRGDGNLADANCGTARVIVSNIVVKEVPTPRRPSRSR